MDQSRRAVEAYWRTRLIDSVTTDEDKVAPVYKLEETCELLRNSPAGIVKEISDYILKRLDHKSPVVKQKALRLIKYAVGKSGNEFRREMQRHSAVVRQLAHYKGQVDPLKGDALNKAVRETANEAVAAIFAIDDSKAVAPSEGLGKRIQGFGNTNFEPQTEEKKSFLTEVVGLSGASIIQGLSGIAAAHSSLRKEDAGSYRSPNLRRSLTTESDIHNENGGNRQSWVSSGASKADASGPWGSDSRTDTISAATIDDGAPSNTTVKSREERLLETIVTSGGVRLQPTRDALQAFLTEASKLDAVAMSRAIDMKLQSHLWQVRMKAMCVLEAILRKKDDDHFFIMASYFSENLDSVVKCTEVPQVSLREKATKVLSLLDDEQVSGAVTGQPLGANAAVVPTVQMPDLIDTGDLDESNNQNSIENNIGQGGTRLQQSGSLVDDFFGSDVQGDLNPTETREDSDPFADVSFHSSEGKEQNDLFSGLTVDGRSDINVTGQSPDLFDVFGTNSENLLHETGKETVNVNDLMSGLNLNSVPQGNKQPEVAGTSGGVFNGVNLLNNSSYQNQLPANGAMNANFSLNSLYSQGPVQYNLPQVPFNQGFPSQPLNYGAMGAFIAQQQLLLQNLGNYSTGFVHSGNPLEGSHSSAFPDIFQLSGNPIQNQATSMTSSKKEETKAFDFITDHLSAARDSKKIL